MALPRPSFPSLRPRHCFLTIAALAMCCTAPASGGGWGGAFFNSWSLRPGAPEVVPAYIYSPADIFIGGFPPLPWIPPLPLPPLPPILRWHPVFGLLPEHNIDGNSWGGTPIATYPPGGNNLQAVFFSVDAASAGLAPVIVAQVAGNGAHGDIFGQVNVGAALGPIFQAIEGTPQLGITALLSDVDAWSGAGPGGDPFGDPVMFSLDPVSAAFLGLAAADVLWNVPPAPMAAMYATGAQLGLLPGDDIDAVDCSAFPGPGGFNPIAVGDRVYFSLAPGSPTLLMNGFSAADILFIDFGAMLGPAVWAPAAGLGLLFGDNIDAIDIWDPGYDHLIGDGAFLEDHLGHRCPDDLPEVPGMARTALGTPEPARLSSPSGVPSSANSTVSPCLVACPRGDIPFAVVVRDGSSNPLPSLSVVLDFSLCANFNPCPEDSGYVVDPDAKTITTMTDGLGTATFHLRLGGTCAAGSVRIYAAGVLLTTRALASPDQNGDLIVTGLDRDLLIPKGGTTDPTGDLDCDGIVTGVYTVVDVPPLVLPAEFGAVLGPNPIRGGELAHLQVRLPSAAAITLELFDVSGRMVDRQVTGGHAPGNLRLQWRPPMGLSFGLYALRVSDGHHSVRLKAVILRP